jgi:hypothetical protein
MAAAWQLGCTVGDVAWPVPHCGSDLVHARAPATRDVSIVCRPGLGECVEEA